MTASAIARANDSISDRINDERWERHEAEKRYREVARFRAEVLAEDPAKLRELRAKGELNYSDVGVISPDGTRSDLDDIFDLIRDAARSGDLPRAQHLSIAAQKAIVAELSARPDLLGMKETA